MQRTRNFRRTRRMPRAFAVLIARCLALVLIATNVLSAGGDMPVRATDHADGAVHGIAAHHHCGGEQELKAFGHGKHASGGACCDGQGCNCLHAVVASAMPWRVQAAIPRGSDAFAKLAPTIERLNLPPRWRPPIA